MMNKFPLALAPCLLALQVLAALPARAQQNAVRVLYARQVPRVVRQKMPRGYKSRFFGTCKLPSLKQEVLFHLSSKLNKERLPPNENCTLDVFTRVQRGRKVLLRQRNTVHFSAPADFNRIIGDVMWADPKTQRIPILRLQLLDIYLNYGPNGPDVLVNFPHGFGARANVQQFASEANVLESTRNIFDRTDERGYTIVQHYRENSALTDATNTYWHWNGEEFASSGPEQIKIK